jgi:hypothetical protein
LTVLEISHRISSARTAERAMLVEKVRLDIARDLRRMRLSPDGPSCDAERDGCAACWVFCCA